MIEEIFLYNTLSRKIEKFIPHKPEKVEIYSCGPTVYDFAHIGNFRSFLLADLLHRVFEYAGFKVKKVQNITDVGHLTNDDLADANGEDKIAKKALKEGKSPEEIAKFFEDEFIKDEKFLNILPLKKENRPRATEYIREQITIIKDLIKNNFAYEKNGSVYFRVKNFKDYGKLSGNSLENLKAGIRVKINDEKEFPLDFALWKKADENHLMQWDFETGTKISRENLGKQKSFGFPGWHIECSAMSRAIFGEKFDIHTGGEDNIFPHHECEIAQNECSKNDDLSHLNCINYWLHAKHLLVNGEKMSKSKGNFYTIKDLREKNWKGEEIRLALLFGHYRSSLNFSEKSLQDARNFISRIHNFLIEISTGLSTETINPKYPEFFREKITKFKTVLFNDLNVPEGLAIISEMIKISRENPLNDEEKSGIYFWFQTEFSDVFGINLEILENKTVFSEKKTTEIEEQLKIREEFKTQKNWEKADKIRDGLVKKYKIEIIDTSEGFSWRSL